MPDESRKTPTVSPESPAAEQDFFWANCAFLNSSELNELDATQEQLQKSHSLSNDKVLFDQLGDKIAELLDDRRGFAESFATIKNQNVAPKTYPMFLKAEHADWPVDFSEVIGGSLSNKADANAVWHRIRRFSSWHRLFC